MNTIIPYLIAVALWLPLLALMVRLHLWVRRHRQPDAARIKILFGLLWILLFIFLVWLASLIFSGRGITLAVSVLLPVLFLLVAASIAFQIRQCQRRLRQK